MPSWSEQGWLYLFFNSSSIFLLSNCTKHLLLSLQQQDSHPRDQGCWESTSWKNTSTPADD